jgi:hypothetical protein
MTQKKPFVYLASPYTLGDKSVNAAYHSEVYRKLVKDSVVTPYAPLLSHYVKGQESIPYEAWMTLCLEVLSRCDAVFTFNVDTSLYGVDRYLIIESSGRDREVAFMRELNRPIFYTLEGLYEWAKDFSHA